MFVFCLISLALFGSTSMALPAGSGSISVSVDKPNYETDNDIVVTLSSATGLPEDDTTLDVIVRKCNALLASSCREHPYREWDDFMQPVQQISVTDTSVTVKVDHRFPSGDYYISIESSKYGKTNVGQSDQEYIYGMSARFKVLYTAGRLYLREPRPEAMWKFDTPHSVKWSAEGFNGGEIIGASVTDAAGNVHELGGVMQEKTGGELTVVPNAAWGEGEINVRIFLADNDAIFASRAVALSAPAAYFKITEPTISSKWTTGNTVVVQFSAHNLDQGSMVTVRAIEPANQRNELIGETTAGAGSIQWVIPESIQFTSSGWIIEIEAAGAVAKSQSESFQITTTATTNGICQVKKLGSEMFLHDEAQCEHTPFVIAAGSRQIKWVKLEWLWCLDDRLRITVAHNGDGGLRITESSKKINNGPSRLFSPLYAAEHGVDFQIGMNNIVRQDTARGKTLTADYYMFPYDTTKINDGPPGVPLQLGMVLETVDAECKCPYEVEMDHPVCEAVEPPCVDPDDPACDGPCVDGDVRAQCTEQLFPRTSIFPQGAKVCSAGLVVNVHGSPCTQANDLLYEINRKITPMTVVNTEEQPGCDKYWLQVEGHMGRGWVIAAGVELCEDRSAFMMATDSAQRTAALPLAATTLAASALLL